jgi:hypothetical protein
MLRHDGGVNWAKINAGKCRWTRYRAKELMLAILDHFLEVFEDLEIIFARNRGSVWIRIV